MLQLNFAYSGDILFMPLKEAIQQIKLAFKTNFKPGIILWILMVLFFVAYATNTAFSEGLGKVSALKKSVGYPFSFGVYVLFAALMPETLKIIFFQKGRMVIKNFHNLIFAGLIFGVLGIITDIFYSYQALWFGEATNFRTIFYKGFVDMGIFSPIANFSLSSIFFLRENGFKSEILKKLMTTNFALFNVLPVIAAGWCIWIPGVTLIYSMPTELQLLVASLILCFWVLIFSFVVGQKAETAKA